ncbi:MAG: glycosyltransferase family 4 protein [Bacteroidetes bacterium]|nr:glycosyltransferase family 4 protein [Bacteroidota bacterium]
MEVIINGKFLCQSKSGVQNFALGITEALLKLEPTIQVILPSTKEKVPLQSKQIGVFKGFLWEQISLPMYLFKNKDSLLINLSNSAPLFCKNQVVTIHDLAFEKEGKNWFTPSFRAWYQILIPKLCKKAKLVFTVSNFSKNELISNYNLPSQKIKIIQNGLRTTVNENKTYENYKYLLVTGGNNPRKNIKWIIQNIDILIKHGYKLVLLLNNDTVFANDHIPTHEHIVSYTDIDDARYFQLLKNASGLIYPSHYEGFGLPILESLSMGVPVIASDLEVFKESFGDLPTYFELNNVTSFENAIVSIKGKTIPISEQDKLKEEYNFDKSAKELLTAIYELKK